MKHYHLFDSIASGGMGTVHYGRRAGGSGLARVVAIKRMHGDLAKDPACLAMFKDELRLATRVRHPNVVATIDMVEQDRELLLVMEYVQGESLQDLIGRAALFGERVPPSIAVSIVCGILQGLEAAHDAQSEAGEPLGIVHRDVSPENILVGRDGIARLLDFGIARSAGRKHVTLVGEIKGKPSYLAPEQILDGGQKVDRRTDIYGAAVVLWEALTGKRLFDGDTPTITLACVLNEEVPPPSSIVKSLPQGLDEVVMRGLSRDPAARFATALEMARELRRVCGTLLAFEVGEWVLATAADSLAQQAKHVAWLESVDAAPAALATSLDEADAPFESTRVNMAFTPPSLAPSVALLDQVSGWLESAPPLQRLATAMMVVAFSFVAGIAVVTTARARPAAPVAAASLAPVRPPIAFVPAPVVSEVPVMEPAPPPTPAAKSKKKHTVWAPAAESVAPPVRLAQRPVIDDGF